jgi:hypothetical protein
MELKRDVVKYVRDKAKSRYVKGPACEICGSTQRLDFHHFYSLTPLLYRWIRANKLDPKNVVDFRDDFIEAHEAELYEHAVTICHNHHLELHSRFGKDPSLGTAKKQMKWVERKKHAVV